MITVKCLLIVGSFQNRRNLNICRYFLSPFSFAKILSEYIASMTVNNVTDALRKHHKAILTLKLSLLWRKLSLSKQIKQMLTNFVDLLQFCIYCIRSGVKRCTRLMMPYLDRMCQCGLHAVRWSHIGILMRHLALPHDFCFPLNVPLERFC